MDCSYYMATEEELRREITRLKTEKEKLHTEKNKEFTDFQLEKEDFLRKRTDDKMTIEALQRDIEDRNRRVAELERNLQETDRQKALCDDNCNTIVKRLKTEKSGSDELKVDLYDSKVQATSLRGELVDRIEESTLHKLENEALSAKLVKVKTELRHLKAHAHCDLCDNEKNVLFRPCNHMMYCNGCIRTTPFGSSLNIETCPFPGCKRRVEEFVIASIVRKDVSRGVDPMV